MNKKNIFKNAYFGKAYKTRDGGKAVYLFAYNSIIQTTHNLVINVYHDDTHLCEIVTDDEGLVGSMESPLDIISEWQQEINEEELDKLAGHEYPYEYYTSLHGEEEAEYKDDLREAFKAGYRKAMEEKL